MQNCGVVASSNSGDGVTPPQPAECDEEEDPGMQLDVSGCGFYTVPCTFSVLLCV